MPWWGWVLIVVAVIVAPLKLRVLKSIFKKDKEDENAA